MSFRVVARVLDDSDERLSRRIILFVLAEAAHDDGVVFVGQEEIARKGRLARTHVAEELKAMEADEVLQIRKAQRGRKRISVYRLNLPGLPEIDYDRLPFVLNKPFADVANKAPDDVGTSDTVQADGVGSGGLTVSELEENDRVGPLVVNHPSEPEALIARDARDTPPKLIKVAGRDQAFDALAEACGVDPNGNRAREVGIALNGSKQTGVGIRTLVWPDARAAGLLPEDGERFERFIVGAIHERARQYRERMNGAMLTPLALAKWWTDIANSPAQPHMKFGRRDVSATEMLAAAERLEQRKEIERESG